MNNTAEKYTHGPLDGGQIDRLNDVLMPFVQNGVLAIVMDGKPLDEDIDKQNAWVIEATETLAPHIATLLATVGLPPLPVQPRDRITLENLFGDYHPDTLDEGEIEKALDHIKDAKEISPLTDEEAQLERELNHMMGEAGYTDAWVPEGSAHDHLNSQLPSNFPDWLNDGIDWEKAYNYVTRNAPTAELDGYTYLLLPNDNTRY